MIPDDDPMVALVTSLLLHVPPPVASLNVVENPLHIVNVPVIAAGTGFTVAAAVVMQPVGKAYVIVGLPAATPVTMPLPVPTVAKPVLLLLHVPPVVPSLSVVVWLTQTDMVPVMPAGSGLTVSADVIKQPVGKV